MNVERVGRIVSIEYDMRVLTNDEAWKITLTVNDIKSPAHTLTYHVFGDEIKNFKINQMVKVTFDATGIM